MNRSLLCAILLVVMLLVLGACGSRGAESSAATQAVAEAGPSVEIRSAQEGDIIIIVPNGQRISLRAHYAPMPMDVSFQWTCTGSGSLTSETDPTIQYVAPESVDVEEEVTITVIMTDRETNRTVRDDIVIRLLPPTSTPTPIHTPLPSPTELSITNTPTLPDTPTPKLTELPVTGTPSPTGIPTMANAVFVDQPPEIDGRLDDEAWSQAQPLTYAVHPPVNDSTTAVVRLLWDDQYLYAGFEVSDTQVEDSSIDTPFDGDSVSVIIDNGGQIQEHRYSLLGDINDRQRLVPDKAGTTSSESDFKGVTTFNDPSDQDEGYSVEMRIPWATTPAAGSTIAADFLSVDHDQNPGEKYDHPDTVFSKISWDGDQNVETARKSILLAGTPLVTDTPTPSPTPECVSLRPPLESATDFAGDVEITIPINCTTGIPVETSIPVAGTYEGIPDDVDIWVLVYPPNLVYYPQSPDACAGAKMSQRGGRWQVSAYLGTKAGKPEWFDLVVVLADQEASQFLSNWVRDGCANNWVNYNGIPAFRLEQLNITEKAYITVQTLD